MPSPLSSCSSRFARISRDHCWPDAVVLPWPSGRTLARWAGFESQRGSGLGARYPAGDLRTDKSPDLRGLRVMRRRGLEPPPGYPGPGPQSGDAGVISVRTAPNRPYRPGARTIRTHRTIWMLPRMLPRAGTAGGAWRRGERYGRSARVQHAPSRAATDRSRPLAAAECVAAAAPRMQERHGADRAPAHARSSSAAGVSRA